MATADKLTEAFADMGYELKSEWSEVTGRLALLCTDHKLDEVAIALQYYHFQNERNRQDPSVPITQCPHINAMDKFDRFLYKAERSRDECRDRNDFITKRGRGYEEGGRKRTNEERRTNERGEDDCISPEPPKKKLKRQGTLFRFGFKKENPVRPDDDPWTYEGHIFMAKKVFCGYCGNIFRHGGALFQHELHAHKLKTEMGQGNKEDEGNESEKSTAGIIPFLKANEDTIPFPEKDVPHWIVENVLFDLTWDMIMKKKEEEEEKKRRDQKLTQAFLAMGYDLQSQEVTGRLASLCTVHKLDEDMIAVLYYYFVDQNVITHQSPHMEAMDDFHRYLHEAAADKNTENTDIPSTSAASDEMTTSKGGSWEAFRTLAIKFCNYFLPSTNCTGG